MAIESTPVAVGTPASTLTTPAGTDSAAPAPAAEPTPAPAPERISPKIAAAVQKQKELAAAHVKLQQEQAAWQAKQAEISAKEAAVAKRQAEIDAWEKSFKENPVKALEQRGLTYSQLTEMALAGNVTAEYQIQLVKQELDQVKAQREAEIIETRRVAEQSAISGFKAQIAAHVDAAADKYPYIKSFDQTSLIFDTIDKHAQDTGKIMGIDEAAVLVETYLADEAKKLAAKIPQPKAPEPAAAAAPEPQSEPQTSSEPQWSNLVPQPRKLKGKPSLSNSASPVTPSISKPQSGLTVDQWLAKNRR